ncbi:iron uptake protein [Pelomonas sp. HMWF004]|nr:iron uptake protein [Pelomonas sp. HMWF004]
MGTSALRSQRKLALVARITVAILGGYAFCWGFIALSLAGLYAGGMGFHDAEHLSSIVGLLLYLVVFCWAFVARLDRACLVLLGGAALMASAAQLLQRGVLG